MIYYNNERGKKKSLTCVWCFLLAIMFAWKGQWALHFAALAIGTADAAYITLLEIAAKANGMKIK